MEKGKLNLKHILIVLCILIIIIVALLIPKLWGSDNHIKSIDYSKVETEIKIDAEDDEGNITNYMIAMVDDTSIAKIETSFLDGMTYIIGNDVYYEEGGRYKTFKVETSYRNLYDTIRKIELESEVVREDKTVNYNPKVSKDNINEILRDLFIVSSTKRDESAYVVVEDGVLNSFSLYLIDIEGYRGVNITISFNKLDDKFKIDRPVIYEQATDKVDENRFEILR